MNFHAPQQLLGMVAFLAVVAVAVHSKSLRGQMANDRLEPATWTLGETDCAIASGNWKVTTTTDEFRSAPSSSRILVNAGWGTRVLASLPVPPAHVIDELKPSVWIKATRPEVQLFVRVVLPRTEDPHEAGPMTVLLPGPVCHVAGRWQKLDFAENSRSLPELLQQAVWKLRSRFETPIDDGEAWIDRLVLNVYSGPGVNTVWVDDVELPGSVAVERTGNGNTASTDGGRWPVRQASWQESPAERRPSLAQCNSTILEVRGQPFFARIIQHNGEPLEMLRDLGFNTIELARPATLQELRQAEQLDLWIICPAPQSAGLEPVSADYDRVLAWIADAENMKSDINGLTNRIREIRRSDFREKRPVVAISNSHLRDLARACDILSLGFEPISGSFVLSQYSDWLVQRTRVADRSLPVWATVQTEIPETVVRQTSALTSTAPPLPLDPAQMRFMAYEAVAGGARGMRFTSRSRLDAADPVARLRSLTLRWLNAHLRHLEPWVSGGAVVNRRETDGEQLATLSTPRGKLILVQRTSHREQWSAGETAVTSYRFSDPSPGTSEQAYHLSENGLMLLEQGRQLAGTELVIENCGPLESVVVTDQPVVINRMAESYLLAGARGEVQMHVEISRQWLAICQLINEQLARGGQGRAAASGSVNEANNALRQAQALIANGSALSAEKLLAVADQHLAAARRDILDSAREPFPSATSTPLLAHVALVPLHFDLASRIDPAAWQPNGLAGGDFENLQHMTDNGWENHRAPLEGIGTRVELASGSAARGNSALSMRVFSESTGIDNPFVDRGPLWIQSGEVPVRAGQLVRIHGWVNVPRAITGSLEGLRIVDSIGGPDFAERIHATRGWSEFSMYRCPSQDVNLRLTFEMTGLGEVFIDEVQVHALDATSRSTARDVEGDASRR